MSCIKSFLDLFLSWVSAQVTYKAPHLIIRLLYIVGGHMHPRQGPADAARGWITPLYILKYSSEKTMWQVFPPKYTPQKSLQACPREKRNRVWRKVSERKTARRQMRRDRSFSEALTTERETVREAVWIRVFLLRRLEGGMMYSIWVKRMCSERKRSGGPGVHARRRLED